MDDLAARRELPFGVPYTPSGSPPNGANVAWRSTVSARSGGGNSCPRQSGEQFLGITEQLHHHSPPSGTLHNLEHTSDDWILFVSGHNKRARGNDLWMRRLVKEDPEVTLTIATLYVAGNVELDCHLSPPRLERVASL
jgi:hypothetical protein